MFHALLWFFVLGLLAIWSLGAWAFHSIATWAVASAGVMTGGAASGSLRLPEALAPWIPSELARELTAMLAAVTPAVEGLIASAPALSSGLSVMVWVAWGLGSALLIALGVALSGAIAMLRRRTGGGSAPTIAARPVH